MELQEYLKLATHWLATTGIRIALVLALMAAALVLVRLVSSRVFGVLKKQRDSAEFQKRTETLSSVVRYVLSITVVMVALMIVLGQVGIEVGPIVAAAGVVGLAVGFGAQSLVKDVISGFFILLEDQIRVGDVVQVAGKAGVVERLNLKMTVLRDLAGNVHFVPNGTIDVVTNMTKEFSRYVFEIGVAYRENVDEVIEVVKEVDAALRADPDYSDDIIEPIEILGLDQFADSAVVIKARTTTRPVKQWRVGREFNRRLKQAFDEKGIEIPFPHRTLYLGEDKQGNAPPLHLSVDQTASEQSPVASPEEPERS